MPFYLSIFVLAYSPTHQSKGPSLFDGGREISTGDNTRQERPEIPGSLLPVFAFALLASCNRSETGRQFYVKGENAWASDVVKFIKDSISHLKFHERTPQICRPSIQKPSSG